MSRSAHLFHKSPFVHGAPSSAADALPSSSSFFSPSASCASTPTMPTASPATVYSDGVGRPPTAATSAAVDQPDPPTTAMLVDFVRAVPKGAVRFPPFQDDLGGAAQRAVAAFRVYPLGSIEEYCRHIPYASGKKDFFEKTGRDGFEVFQYVFRLPGDDKEFHVMWDYNVGLVRMTPFFKCCKYGKTAPGKMLSLNPGLREVSYSITGGSIAAQGYWMPYACARAVCATFCYPIAGALIPLFGPEFPSHCVPPQSPDYGRMVIDPALVAAAARETEGMRQLAAARSLDDHPDCGSRPRAAAPAAGSLQLHVLPPIGRRVTSVAPVAAPRSAASLHVVRPTLAPLLTAPPYVGGGGGGGFEDGKTGRRWATPPPPYGAGGHRESLPPLSAYIASLPPLSPAGPPLPPLANYGCHHHSRSLSSEEAVSHPAHRMPWLRLPALRIRTDGGGDGSDGDGDDDEGSSSYARKDEQQDNLDAKGPPFLHSAGKGSYALDRYASSTSCYPSPPHPRAPPLPPLPPCGQGKAVRTQAALGPLDCKPSPPPHAETATKEQRKLAWDGRHKQPMGSSHHSNSSSSSSSSSDSNSVAFPACGPPSSSSTWNANDVDAAALLVNFSVKVQTGEEAEPGFDSSGRHLPKDEMEEAGAGNTTARADPGSRSAARSAAARRTRKLGEQTLAVSVSSLLCDDGKPRKKRRA